MINKTQIKLSNLDQALELGLKKEEFVNICDVLGRTPNFTELSIYLSLIHI